MPIYEYRCESCEHRLEKLQKLSEGVLVDCPECKHPTLKRLISATAFRLKGSGWYETDFKKDNKRNLADSAGTDTSSTDTSSKVAAAGDSNTTDKTPSESGVAKTEAKPATSTASKDKENA